MDELRIRIEAAVAEQAGAPVRVLELAPVAGGACQENYRVVLQVADGPPETVALRGDAQVSLPGSVGRAVEFAVVEAAAAGGVPTPHPRWLCRDLVRRGADAWFMDWVEGTAIGARVVRHPSLVAARAALPGQLARALAAVHRITPATHPGLPLAPVPDPVDDALVGLRGMLNELPRPRPALELAFRWLVAHRPSAGETTLLHGDFRTGNFMVDPSGLVAVLDWEFTRWGDPLEDIGWLCMRDWRFGALDKPAGGVADRATFYRAYSEASGRPVDPARIHFWEVAGNVRWAAAAVFQGERYLSGGSEDLEMLAIPLRVPEMEWEALRLLELGPPEVTS